jgi:hypothetical protein
MSAQLVVDVLTAPDEPAFAAASLWGVLVWAGAWGVYLCCHLFWSGPSVGRILYALHILHGADEAYAAHCAACLHLDLIIIGLMFTTGRAHRETLDVLTAPARPAFAAAWGVLAWAGAWAVVIAFCAWTVALGGLLVAATAAQLVDERVLYKNWTPGSAVVCNRYVLFWWVFNIVVVNCIRFYFWSVAVRNLVSGRRVLDHGGWRQDCTFPLDLLLKFPDYGYSVLFHAYCSMWFIWVIVAGYEGYRESRNSPTSDENLIFLRDYTGGACSYADVCRFYHISCYYAGTSLTCSGCRT